MKSLSQILLTTVLASILLLVNVAYAHEASKHKKKNAEKPKCELVKNMDHSKMDMNDPIMQAVMKQCVGVNGLYTTNKDAKHDDNIKREEHGEEVHHN